MCGRSSFLLSGYRGCSHYGKTILTSSRTLTSIQFRGLKWVQLNLYYFCTPSWHRHGSCLYLCLIMTEILPGKNANLLQACSLHESLYGEVNSVKKHNYKIWLNDWIHLTILFKRTTGMAHLRITRITFFFAPTSPVDTTIILITSAHNINLQHRVHKMHYTSIPYIYIHIQIYIYAYIYIYRTDKCIYFRTTATKTTK